MLVDPTSTSYASATTPHNAVEQRPTRVALISTPEDLVDALSEVATLRAGQEDWDVVVQATGHGAGATVDARSVLFDTSRLSGVQVDPVARTATVGAGATWSQVNEEAQRHGLLGLAGSAPSVSVSGYTFAGGIGWLVRQHGLASNALRRVHYLDPAGRMRIAADDAEDQLDRDAIWAFRGAGGVGIAHTLEFDLVPVPDLYAGALLWHSRHLEALVSAWAAALDTLEVTVSSSIGVLHVPPMLPFLEQLHGQVAVHLAIADSAGAAAAAPLLEAMRAIAEPVVDDWGPKDAAGLARIHLDPPDPVPALGDARWLDDSTPQVAAALLGAAVAEDSPLVMAEIRHVSRARATREGAVVEAPGSFIFHTVAVLGRSTRDEIKAAFTQLAAIWAPADTGRTPGSWLEGAASVEHALPSAVAVRARGIADRVDPDRRIRRSRLLG